MFGHLNDPSPPGPGPEDREAVMRRAQSITRHRQMAMGVAAAALVALIAVPAFALTGSGGSHRKVNTIGAPTTQSNEDTTTTPTTAQDTTTTPGPTTTTIKRGPAGAATTTTTALVCRNSHDPRCGPFYWDPAPAPNQPLTVHITYSPSQPVTGQQVTFHIVADDPDAPIACDKDANYWSPQFGDGSRGYPCVTNCPAEFPTYGPWTPPAPEPSHAEGDLTHVYSSAGQYTMRVEMGSGFPCTPSPYGNQQPASVTVTVSGPPVVTTTTAH